MKNVFVYIGSRNIDSRVFKYTMKIVEQLKVIQSENVKIEVFTPLNSFLMPSTGCKSCFQKGICPNEELEKDEGVIIKQTMENADIIILASPVYSHNVSSDMKLLIDRLSYWAHLFKLAGKPGVVIATAESNGASYVSGYLDKVLTYMGVKVEHKVDFVNSEDDLAEHYIKEAVEAILKLCDSNYEFRAASSQELTFQTLKMILKEYPKDHFEYKYWKENNFFEFNSYNELLNRYVKN